MYSLSFHSYILLVWFIFRVKSDFTSILDFVALTLKVKRTFILSVAQYVALLILYNLFFSILSLGVQLRFLTYHNVKSAVFVELTPYPAQLLKKTKEA